MVVRGTMTLIIMDLQLHDYFYIFSCSCAQLKLRCKAASVLIGNGGFETTLSAGLSKLGMEEPKN